MPNRRAIHPATDIRPNTGDSGAIVSEDPTLTDPIHPRKTIPNPIRSPIQETWLHPATHPEPAHSISEPPPEKARVTAVPPSDLPENDTAILTLRVVAGRDMLQFITLLPGDELMIGRDEAGGMILVDSSVSRKHARLTCLTPHTILLQDLGSTNGTCILDDLNNRKPVTEPQVLTVGAWLEVGTVMMHLERLNLNQLGHLERTVDRFDAPDREASSGLFPASWLEKKLGPLQQEHVRTNKSLCGLLLEIEGIEMLQLRLGSLIQDLLFGFYRLVLWKVRAKDHCILLNERSVFVVLENESLESAEDVATRLVREIAAYRWSRNLHGYRMKLKTGCSLWTPGESTQQWIARAQAALKASRRKVR